MFFFPKNRNLLRERDHDLLVEKKSDTGEGNTRLSPI